MPSVRFNTTSKNQEVEKADEYLSGFAALVRLILDFHTEDDNTLRVVFEDNGIGRMAAKKLRKKGTNPATCNS